jgi:uncharacterized protein (TIGR01244 family)
MDMRQITETYFVAPQIDPSDAAVLAAAGIVRVICNRPDMEVPASHQSSAMAAAMAAAGVDFQVLPLTHQSMTAENVGRQAELIESAGGPVLAYCASGTRSAIAWSLGQAVNRTRQPDEILASASRAGYQLEGLRPTLMALSGN